MAKNNKLNKERKKLSKGSLIYTLEIAVNPEEGTVEYIVEGLEEVTECSGAINSLEDECGGYVEVEDYFDEDGINLLDDIYVIGES